MVITEEAAAGSVLYRTWRTACISAWIIHIFLEVGVGLDKLFSTHPFCAKSNSNLGVFYLYSCSIAFGGFLFTWLILLTRILQTAPGIDRVPYFVAFNVVSIGLSASFLELFFNWGGVCIDSWGY